MAKGRRRKPGARTKSGQLSRSVKLRPAVVDRGNDRVSAMVSLYGENYSDAIGRAFERGLLGSGQNAKALLDTARAIHRAYWAWYANGPIRCALADRTGAAIGRDDERERKQEEWLNRMLARAGRGGHPVRTLFDQLVIDVNPDNGPAWLDRILAKEATAMDWGRLSAATDALADCADVPRLTSRLTARRECA